MAGPNRPFKYFPTTYMIYDMIYIYFNDDTFINALDNYHAFSSTDPHVDGTDDNKDWAEVSHLYVTLFISSSSPSSSPSSSRPSPSSSTPAPSSSTPSASSSPPICFRFSRRWMRCALTATSRQKSYPRSES